jgi:histidinol dehydrogenase
MSVIVRLLDPVIALAILGGCAALAAVAYGARLIRVDLIHGDWGPEWSAERDAPLP